MDYQVSEFEPLLTEQQVAKWLGLSTHTLRNDRSRKIVGVPYILIGRTVRYDPVEVRNWLNECRRTPAITAITPRLGRPTAREREEARKAGVSVTEFRRRRVGLG
jgi:hypothetical protein